MRFPPTDVEVPAAWLLRGCSEAPAKLGRLSMLERQPKSEDLTVCSSGLP